MGEFITSGSKMQNEDLNREQLLLELKKLRQRIVELEKSGIQNQKRDKVQKKSDEGYGDLEDIVNHTPIVVFLLRAVEGWPVDFVTENIRNFGYIPDDFYSGRFHYVDIIHPDDLARVADEVASYSTEDGCESFKQEYRIITKDGDVCWIDDRTWIRRDENGNITHYQGTVLDITERIEAEKALKKSETKYRTIFEHTGTATVIIEEDTIISLANTEFEKLSGLAREEIEGKKSWTEFVEKDDLEKMREYHSLRRIDPQSVPVFYDFRFIDRNGTVKNIHLDIGMIPGTKKSVASLLDITERKAALEEIQRLYEMEREARAEAEASKEQISTVLERISDSFVALDTNWHYTYVNKKAADQFGKTPEEMVGEHIWAMFPEGVGQPFYKAYNRAMKEQVFINLEEYYPPYDKWFENDIYPSEDGITIFFKEITERVKMQEALLSKERELSSIYNNISDVLYSLSVEERDNYKFISVNQAFLDVTGLTETQVVGKYVHEIIPEPSLKIVLENYKKAIEGEKTVRWEEITDYPTGRKYGEVSITPVFDTSGQCKKLIGTVHDITERVEMQQEILFKNTLLEAQLESTLDGILVVDDDGKSILHNQRFGEMWNIPSTILDSKDDKKMISYVLDQLKYPESFTQRIKHLYANKDEKSRDEIKFKDGRVFERYSSPLIDANGNYNGRIWYFRDITELKRSEEALRKSEQNYRELVDTSLVGVYRTNLKGDILFANKAMANLGLLDGFEDFKGRNIIEFYNDPADREKLIKILKKEGKVNQYEMEMVSDFGDIVNVLISASLSDDIISGMIIDITEKKKAEKALLSSESKYRALFDNAADGIFLMKKEHFIECNERVLEIYGVSRDQIIGHNPIEFSPEQQPDGQRSEDKAMEFINQALQGNPQHFEWKHIRYDGIPFFAEVSLNRVKIEDEYLIQAIVRDVTERKQAEELEKENIKLQELDKLKSMFIASMSHELRTPLNSIIGFTGIMLQGLTGELTDEQKKQLSIVKNSANHLLALINDVIDISKIEADKVELFIEDFDLSEVLLEIEESFMDTVNRKGLTTSLDMPESLFVKGDERRIKQVIMNFVSNAVKFTEKGKINISVVEKGGTVEVSVKDTGIGIKEEDQHKLFKAFSRIHVEDQPIVEGTGLGLYLSKKIAHLLGGDIQAKSQFNVGSEFIFIFPKNIHNRG